MARRKLIGMVLAGLVLPAAAGWSGHWMARNRRAVRDTAAELAEIRQSADGICAVRNRMLQAREHEQTPTETIAAVERAAEEAGIGSSCLTRTSAIESPARAAGSPYREKATRVQLELVSLEQVVRLLHGLAVAPQPLQARSVRLTGPQGEDAGGLWAADLVLSYIVFDPSKAEK